VIESGFRDLPPNATRGAVTRISTAVILVLLAVTSEAEAQDDRAQAQLRWASAACVQADVLAAAVEERLGRRVFVADEADLNVSGIVVPDANGVVARIELRRGDDIIGTREVHARDCLALERALPIMLALAVDLEQRDIAITLEPSVEPEPSPPSSPPPSHAIAPAARAVSLALRVGGAVELGLLPDPAASTRVSLRIEPHGAFPLELRLAALLPSSSVRDGVGVGYWGALGALAGCPRLARSQWLAIEACLAVEGGALVVHGEGFATNRQGFAPLFDVLVGLRGMLTFPGVLEIGLEASVGVPIPANRFTVTASDGTEREAASGAPIIGRLEITVGTVGS
jgi:hypothetical protein